MMVRGIVWTAEALWFALAILLVIAEIIVPGFFLIFLAAGAAVTGAIVLVAPGLPVLVQALLYVVFTGAAVAAGWRWYRNARHAAPADPLLNDRGARLIGQTVAVCEAIVGGAGRVVVADGSWPARGPDAAAGGFVRVIAVRDGALIVELL